MRMIGHKISALSGHGIMFCDVSLDLTPGRVIIIQGDNGVGKSTLMDILSGVTLPWSGSVRCYDSEDREIEPKHDQQLFRDESHVSYLLQGMPKTQGTTVTAFMGIGRNAETAHQIGFVDSFRVAHLADQQLQNLSGGEWRRVQLARLWSQLKPFVLLDEPEASLDPLTRLALLKNIVASGKTGSHGFVIVTHELQWLMGLDAEYFKLTRFGLVRHIL